MINNSIKANLRVRFRAGLLHLGISALVALLALCLIFGLWYPGVFAEAQGVSRLVLILICVDVIIGPLITTIVYAPGKKSLRFDLAVVAALQTVALLYGMQAIYGGRPAYLVFNVDRFDLVPIQDVGEDSIRRAAPEFRPSFFGPRTVSARLPMNREARNALLFSAVSGGPDLPQLPEYFVPLEAESAAMLAHLRPLEELQGANDLDATAWRAVLDSIGHEKEALGYLPMVGNAKDGVVLLDRTTAHIVDIRLLSPKWTRKVAPTPAGTPVSGISPVQSAEHGS